MKAVYPISLAVLLFSNPLFGLVNLGEGRIDLTLRSGLTYDSEIFSSARNLSDTIFTITPTLEYTRPSRNMAINVSTGLTVYRYFEYTEYDDADFFLNLNLDTGTRMETSRFTLTGDLILNTETRSDETVGAIITTRNYGVSSNAIYDPNRNYTIIADASIRRRDPDSPLYNEQDFLDTRIRLQVPIAEPDIKGELGVSYDKVQSRETGSADSQTFSYFLGLDGQILPKVSGSVHIGYQMRELQDGNDTNSPTYRVALIWTIDELTSSSLSASRSYGTSIDNSSNDSTSITLSVSRALNRDMKITGSVGYRLTEYQIFSNRSDDAVFMNLRVSYDLSRDIDLAFFAQYSDQTSTEELFEFDRTRVGVEVTARW